MYYDCSLATSDNEHDEHTDRDVQFSVLNNWQLFTERLNKDKNEEWWKSV
jgi:hypothetical protein